MLHDTQVVRLRDRFINLARTPASQTISAGWFDVLAGLYGSPGRYYHTLEHIADLLARLDAATGNVVGVDTMERRTVEIAIWFHDAIYDVRRKDNEESSTSLAAAYFVTVHGANDHCAPEVIEAIYATTHKPLPGPTFPGYPSLSTQLMLDIDLAGFADPWEAFDAKSALIRQEYAIYTDDDFRIGRAQIMASFLQRPRIYYLLTDLEAPARVNLKRHIKELVG